MDDLTPEAVKAALEVATPEPWVVGASEGRVLSHWEGIGYWEIANAVETSFRGDSGVEYSAGGTQEGNAALIAMVPALARDWLRLKKVEEAGQWVKKNPCAHPDLVRRIICDAVEGK